MSNSYLTSTSTRNGRAPEDQTEEQTGISHPLAWLSLIHTFSMVWLDMSEGTACQANSLPFGST